MKSQKMADYKISKEGILGKLSVKPDPANWLATTPPLSGV